MPKQTKSARLKQAKATIDKAVGDYSKHPFFIKKANEAKQLLKKVGLPKKQSIQIKKMMVSSIAF